MLIQESPPLHLTYCLNIHPGEIWQENLQAIRTHALKVRDRLAGGRPFGLGLRLSAVAADPLRDPQQLGRFRDFLRQENLYVFTINGFPYGQFHDTAVKEKVYSPDWQDPRRRDYSMQLADILAALLPEGVPGSISTVPCSYKTWIHSPQQVATMCRMLADVAAYLAEIHGQTGRDICLALEPEPDCYIERTAEAVAFFRGPLLEHGLAHLKSSGRSAAQAEECLRRHVGICLDTAHAAVEFEDPACCLRQLQQAGLRVGKVQLSAALSVEASGPALQRLADFQDRVYLHQVKAMDRDGLQAYRDLPEALANHPQASPASGGARSSHATLDIQPRVPKEECFDARTELRGLTPSPPQLRVHFHVPLFCDRIEPLASTASLLTGEFWNLLRSGLTGHAEIETYTFAVLPRDLQTPDVTDSIVREYQWVLDRMGRDYAAMDADAG